MKKFIIVFVTMALALTSVSAAAGNIPEYETAAAASETLVAFPGAEGGGMYTTGARGASSPTIYHVTNLNNSGSGSLRDAVSESGRIIVFDIAGTINLTSQLNISASNLTILGQTSPGDGICISGAPTSINGSNIILRYLRFRMGVYDEDAGKYDGDALGAISNNSNLMIDHCSMSWSTDECCSIYAVKDSTIQWCIMTEPLNVSIHDEGDGVQNHGYGGIWGGVNVSYHHNLVSSAISRFPRVGTSATVRSYNNEADSNSLLDVRNNVFYNWKSNTSYGGENMVRVNLVNNYYKEGPASSSINRFYEMYSTKSGSNSKHPIVGAGTDLAIGGNYYDSKNGSSAADEVNADNTKGVTWDSGTTTYKITEYDKTQSDTEALSHTQYIYSHPIYTDTAQDAFNKVLSGAGASISRDAVDERAVSDALNRTAENGSNGIINLSDLKLMPTITYSGTKETDSDGDGMSDVYEDTYGLNKNDASDALKQASSGYYNIEEYSFNLASDEAVPTPEPTITPEPTATPVPRYNIEIDDNIENGSIAVNGVTDGYTSWEASEHTSEINGAKTVNLNGANSSNGTLTFWDSTTTLFEYNGMTIARGEINPSITYPISDAQTPSGSVYSVKTAADGELQLELYIYGGNKKLHIYDSSLSDDVLTETIASEDIYYRTIACEAGHEYYMWVDGSKIGIKNVTVTGGSISASLGETVTVNTTADSGYRTGSVYTNPECEITKVSDDEYTFVMPDSAVTVGAVFVSGSLPDETPAPVSTETPAPVSTETPAPVSTETPVPVSTETPAPVSTETPVPVSTETPAPVQSKVFYSALPQTAGKTATASVTNLGDESGALFVAAAYENNLLAEVKTQIISISDEAQDIVFEFTKDYGDIRFYLWSFGTLEPYSEVK